jgi:hypothetical protein
MVARSRGAAAAVLIITCALALAAMGAALTELPAYWPLHSGQARLDQVQVLRDTAHSLRTLLRGWGSKIFG